MGRHELKSWVWVILALASIVCSSRSTPTSTGTSTATVVSSTHLETASSTYQLEPNTSSASTSLPELGNVGEMLVIGDWGSGTLPQGAVAGAMARYATSARIEAILTTGDNFYSNDAERLMKPFDWAIAEGIPFWITWGNHDVETQDRIEVVADTFLEPDRWDLHVWGDIDVVVLDSNQVDSEEQLVFLSQRMRNSKRPMIVVFHHPAFTCGSYQANRGVAARWLPTFDGDVVLVLNGHDHNYQRFEVEDVIYVVSGGGGQDLYELDSCPEPHPDLIAGAAEHHFLVLEQTTSSLKVRALDVNGERLDEFTVSLR